jgi:serine/threonine-protein kinase haspin
VVLKLVPMEGDTLVNGEPQKRADEILAEVSVTLTLSRLNGAATPGMCVGKGGSACSLGCHASAATAAAHLAAAGAARPGSPRIDLPAFHFAALTAPHLCVLADEPLDNVTSGFVETFGVGVCRGSYAEALRCEWHRWDQEHGSENEEVDIFAGDQLYVVRWAVGAAGSRDTKRQRS